MKWGVHKHTDAASQSGQEVLCGLLRKFFGDHYLQTLLAHDARSIIETMKQLQVPVIGQGRLGNAYADALVGNEELALAGIVPRSDSRGPLAGRLRGFSVVGQVRGLSAVKVTLVCVRADTVPRVARELLQVRIPIVERANFEGEALDSHYAELDNVTRRYRTSAVVRAGASPGVLPLYCSASGMLIPHGQDVFHRHPDASLHQSTAVAHLPGVKSALAGEFRGFGGVLQRYVYVELKDGADFAGV